VIKKNRSNNTRRRKRDMKGDYTPYCTCTSRRVSEKRDSALPPRSPAVQCGFAHRQVSTRDQLPRCSSLPPAHLVKAVTTAE
jgi:hypothetical protein